MCAKHLKPCSILVIIVVICSGTLIILPSTPVIRTVSAMSTWMQTTDIDFIKGTFDNVIIVSTGLEAELKIDRFSGWINESTTPKPNSKTFHKMAFFKSTDKVILFGGFVDEDDTWIFDLSNNTWSKKSISSPPGRYDNGMAAIYDDDKILLFAGSANILGYLSDMWLYDLSDNVWTEIFPYNHPFGRSSTVMASIYGTDKVVLFGGGSHSVYYNDTWIFDLSDNNWTKKNTINSPSAREHHAMASIFGTNKVMLFGGHNDLNYFNETWIYDLADKTWENKKPKNKPSARSYHAIASIWGTDEIMLMGGFDGNDDCDDTWIYDLSDNSWTKRILPENPKARIGHAMATIWGTDNIILFGGENDNNEFDDTWIYHQFLPNVNGTFISSPYNTSYYSTFKTINWDAVLPEGTSIQFQIRTSSTELGLSFGEFIGPDGTTAAYYSSPASNIWSGHNGDTWIQYKVYFNTNLNDKSPILKEISISYNCLPRTVLYSPANGTVIPDNKPTFTWDFIDDSNEQIAFQGLIDDNSDFENVNYDSDEQPYAIQQWQFPVGTSYTTLPDGIWYWKVRIKDNDFDWGEYSPASVFTIDTKIPSSMIDFPINNGSYKYLNIISGTASDCPGGTGLNKVEILIKRFSDNNTWDGFDWRVGEYWVPVYGTTDWWYDSSTVSWTSGNQYQIYSRAMDNATNYEQLRFNIIFTFDTDPPISSIDFPMNNSYLNKISKISGSSIDNGGSGINIVKIKIKNFEDNTYWDGTAWISAINWITAIGTDSWFYNCSDIKWLNGAQYVVNSRAIDNVGNKEFSDLINIFIFDNQPPEDISILINNDDNYTNSSSVKLSLNADDIESEVDKMAFSSDNMNWSTWDSFNSTSSYELSAGDGEKIVFFNVKDKANNTANSVFDTIILDTEPPRNLSIIIDNGSYETSSESVTLKLDAIDDTSGVHQMSFSTDGSNWTSWIRFNHESNIFLPPINGEKIIYFRIKDRAGNIADPIEATIILNTSSPIKDDTPDNEHTTETLFTFPWTWFVIISVILIIMITIIILILVIYRKKRSNQILTSKKAVMVKPSALPKSEITVDHVPLSPKASQLPRTDETSVSQSKPKDPT